MKKNDLIAYAALATASFAIAYLINYDATEAERLILIVGQTCWHIHHWLLISMGLMIGTVLSFLDRHVLFAIVAASAGLVLEGLLYRNFLSIREDCDKAFTITPLSMAQYPAYKQRDRWPSRLLSLL